MSGILGFFDALGITSTDPVTAYILFFGMCVVGLHFFEATLWFVFELCGGLLHSEQ